MIMTLILAAAVALFCWRSGLFAAAALRWARFWHALTLWWFLDRPWRVARDRARRRFPAENCKRPR